MHKKTTLNNGLRVLTNPMPHTHSVSICIFVGVGSRYETEPQAGVSHFIEHLCFRGTTRRTSSREISEAIEGVGGIINAGTDKELTVYWCKVAQPHLPLALDVLADILRNSRFDPPDIERERQVITEEINMSKDSPSQLVNMLIDELLWPRHPLGRDIAGSKESVAAITRETIVDYLAHQYLPANTVVSIAGAGEHGEMVSAVEQALGDWSGLKTRPTYSPYKEQKFPRLRIEKKDTEQAHLCLALSGLPLLHPKRFTFDLLNVILGEGMSSRLFTEIRDRMGLAYNIHSYAEHFSDSGSITVYAGVEPKNLQLAVKAIVEQLSRLKEIVPQTELIKAKELSKGRLMLRMEDSRSVAGWMGGQEILTQRILSVDQVIDIVDAITAEEIRELAREMLVSSQLRLAVVGPVADESLEEILVL
ncbi:MAG TPA: pitrilysin family protein [Dehalococcoidales bacterium]|nr:pitrilysin family protein [Dehalococcoidales bacterium]